MDNILISGQTDKITDHISTGQYDQHNPLVGDGLDGFCTFLGEMAANGQTMEHVKVHRLIRQGNFVVIFSEVKIDGHDWAFFDIFRLKDVRVVEHWDVQEKIGPKDTWNNSGKS